MISNEDDRWGWQIKPDEDGGTGVREPIPPKLPCLPGAAAEVAVPEKELVNA